MAPQRNLTALLPLLALDMLNGPVSDILLSRNFSAAFPGFALPPFAAYNFCMVPANVSFCPGWVHHLQTGQGGTLNQACSPSFPKLCSIPLLKILSACRLFMQCQHSWPTACGAPNLFAQPSAHLHKIFSWLPNPWAAAQPSLAAPAQPCSCWIPSSGHSSFACFCFPNLSAGKCHFPAVHLEPSLAACLHLPTADPKAFLALPLSFLFFCCLLRLFHCLHRLFASKQELLFLRVHRQSFFNLVEIFSFQAIHTLKSLGAAFLRPCLFCVQLFLYIVLFHAFGCPLFNFMGPLLQAFRGCFAKLLEVWVQWVCHPPLGGGFIFLEPFQAFFVNSFLAHIWIQEKDIVVEFSLGLLWASLVCLFPGISQGRLAFLGKYVNIFPNLLTRWGELPSLHRLFASRLTGLRVLAFLSWFCDTLQEWWLLEPISGSFGVSSTFSGFGTLAFFFGFGDTGSTFTVAGLFLPIAKLHLLFWKVLLFDSFLVCLPADVTGSATFVCLVLFVFVFACQLETFKCSHKSHLNF